MSRRRRGRTAGSGSALRGWIGAILALLGLFAAAAFVYTFNQLEEKVTPPSQRVLIEIPRGSGLRAISDSLAKEGVVSSGWLFGVASVLRGRKALQAGEYLFDKPATAFEVYDKIARGDVHRYQVRVPEGSNIFEIAKIVAASGLAKEDEFLAIARQPDLIRDLAPAAPSLEGYLFPDTYSLTSSDSAASIAKQMVERFRKVWKELQIEGNPHAMVTLASLVEKESAVPDERPLVASVYHNRLEKDMRLSCDPTTIYAAMLMGKWDGIIHRSDLDSTHPYNTYQHKGLPPGPIASPGRESLAAAANPASTGFLFFVAKADGSGGHTFSESEKQHLAAVKVYRARVNGASSKPAPAKPRR